MGDNKQLLENLKNREFIPDKDMYFNNLLSELVGVSDNKSVDKKHEDLAVLLVSEIIKLLKNVKPDTNVESPTGQPLTESIDESSSIKNTIDVPEGITGPSEGITGPAEGITGPAEGITGPIEGITGPIGITGPTEGITGPIEGITGPIQQPVLPTPPISTVDTNIPTNGEPDKPIIIPPSEKQKEIPNGIPFPKTEIIEEQKVDGKTTQRAINYYHLTPNNPHQIISSIDNQHK